MPWQVAAARRRTRTSSQDEGPTRVWVDFFSLRQTEKGAFEPLEVVALSK